MNIVSGKVLINKKSECPFEIHIEKLIITIDSDFYVKDLPKDASFLRRFTIIQFPCKSAKLIIDEVIDCLPNKHIDKELLQKKLAFLNSDLT